MCTSLGDSTATDTRLLGGFAPFDNQLSRYSSLLRFIARRVLGGSDGVEEALENCRLAAFQNVRQFESEGAFRSWLFRILIDEASAVRRRIEASR